MIGSNLPTPFSPVTPKGVYTSRVFPPGFTPDPHLPVCRDPAKAAAVQTLFEQYNAELRDRGRFPPPPAGNSSAADPPPLATEEATEEAEASPQTRVWVLYFLAQLYDRLG